MVPTCPQERTALRSLSEMIDDVAAKIEEAMRECSRRPLSTGSICYWRIIPCVVSSDPMDAMVEEADDLILRDPNVGLGDGNVLQNMKNIQTFGDAVGLAHSSSLP